MRSSTLLFLGTLLGVIAVVSVPITPVSASSCGGITASNLVSQWTASWTSVNGTLLVSGISTAATSTINNGCKSGQSQSRRRRLLQSGRRLLQGGDCDGDSCCPASYSGLSNCDSSCAYPCPTTTVSTVTVEGTTVSAVPGCCEATGGACEAAFIVWWCCSRLWPNWMALKVRPLMCGVAWRDGCRENDFVYACAKLVCNGCRCMFGVARGLLWVGYGTGWCATKRKLIEPFYRCVCAVCMW